MVSASIAPLWIFCLQRPLSCSLAFIEQTTLSLFLSSPYSRFCLLENEFVKHLVLVFPSRNLLGG